MILQTSSAHTFQYAVESDASRLEKSKRTKDEKKTKAPEHSD